MSRKKTQVDDLDGTIEGLARDHFEREKAEYEKRTGQKVEFVPPVPLTRTPIPQMPNDGDDHIEDAIDMVEKAADDGDNGEK